MTTLLELLSIFPRRKKLELSFLVFAVLIGAILEAVAVGLVMPFLTFMNDPQVVFRYPTVVQFFASFGATTVPQILSLSAATLFVIFLFKNVYLSFVTDMQFRFVYGNLSEFARQLFENYLKAPWEFHLRRNSAELLRNLNSEVGFLFANVLNPFINLTTECIVTIALIALLVVVDPISTFLAMVVLGGASVIFYTFVRAKTARLGVVQQSSHGEMIKWVNQGLGGIKETKVLGREEFFLDKFSTYTRAYNNATRYLNTINQLPRYFLESVLVGGIVALSMIAIARGDATSSLLPKLALFAAAAYRILPSFTRILSAIANIQYHKPSIRVVKNDLNLIGDARKHPVTSDKTSGSPVNFEREIVFSQLSFYYEGTAQNVLEDVTVTIPFGSFIGILGPSGSGKTTLVDLLLGLLKPTKGKILVDGRDIEENINQWQRSTGYVPQANYLSDDTLRRNIAFGLADTEIDEKMILKSVRDAQLEELVAGLPDGLETFVGERGVRISGGQRQRIGIARALYNNPRLLILDEATSALDRETETEIMKTIDHLKGSITLVVISHRKSTLEGCDFLFEMSKGRVTRIIDRSRHPKRVDV